MVIKDDMVTLTKREVKRLIDRECRKRLNMSADEYLQKRKSGELKESIATHDIEMLLKLA